MKQAKQLQPEVNDPSTNSNPSESAPVKLPELQEQVSKDLVRFFKLLSDETRLRILFYLSQTKELHVRALCDLLNQSQPAVSHHLGMLRNAGIVEPRREGKRNYYCIPTNKFQPLLQILFESIGQDGEAIGSDYRRPAQPR